MKIINLLNTILLATVVVILILIQTSDQKISQTDQTINALGYIQIGNHKSYAYEECEWRKIQRDTYQVVLPEDNNEVCFSQNLFEDKPNRRIMGTSRALRVFANAPIGQKITVAMGNQTLSLKKIETKTYGEEEQLPDDFRKVSEDWNIYFISVPDHHNFQILADQITSRWINSDRVIYTKYAVSE